MNLPKNVELASDNLLTVQYSGILLKEVVSHGGVDQYPLRDLLSQYIDPVCIYSSPIDFGLCTYLLRNRSTLNV